MKWFKCSFLMMIIMIMMISCAKKEKVEFGYVTFYYGEIAVKNDGAMTKPKLKMLLKSGDKVYTKNNARLDIQIPDFGLIRINQNSEIELDRILTDINDSINIGLDNGQLLCKLSKLNKKQDLKVETPTAVVGVRGTTFMAEADKDQQTSEIAVSEGAVEVSDKKEPEKKVQVKQNETAKLDKKSNYLDKVKGIDSKKLKELSAVKNTKQFKDVKNVDIKALKSSSLKNLKNLNIKDMKGLGSEFDSIIPGNKKGSNETSTANKATKKIADTQNKVDEQKKLAEAKKAEAEKKKAELEKQKADAAAKVKQAQEDAKKKLNKLKF